MTLTPNSSFLPDAKKRNPESLPPYPSKVICKTEAGEKPRPRVHGKWAEFLSLSPLLGNFACSYLDQPSRVPPAQTQTRAVLPPQKASVTEKYYSPKLNSEGDPFPSFSAGRQGRSTPPSHVPSLLCKNGASLGLLPGGLFFRVYFLLSAKIPP